MSSEKETVTEKFRNLFTKVTKLSEQMIYQNDSEITLYDCDSDHSNSWKCCHRYVRDIAYAHLTD